LFRGRGKRLDEQIAVMRRIWSGQPVADDVGPIGPRPVQDGGPPLLIGGFAPVVLRRAGRASHDWSWGAPTPLVPTARTAGRPSCVTTIGSKGLGRRAWSNACCPPQKRFGAGCRSMPTSAWTSWPCGLPWRSQSSWIVWLTLLARTSAAYTGRAVRGAPGEENSGGGRHRRGNPLL